MANEEIKKHLDKFHYHEAVDRLNVIMSNCEGHLMQHPVIKIELEVKQNVEKAIEYLWKAYQCTGNLSDKKFKDDN